MYTYEENNNYIDEEKKSRVPFFILFIIIVVIIFVAVLSCGMKEKDGNSNLGYLRITNASITPEFDKNKYTYSVNVTDELVHISCNSESSKAKVEGCNKKLSISNNLTHVIKVIAENGDFKKYTLNITRTVSQTEKINVNIESDIKSGEKTTKAEVKLNAKLSSSVDSAKYEWYKDGIKLENETNSILTANESGTYYIKVITSENTITSNDFIVNIVKEDTKPTTSKEDNSSTKYVFKINSITGNSSTWTKSVTLKVDATSTSGLATEAYSFDGGKTYQKSNSKTFTSNQTVKVVVKDKSGKTVTKEVTISKVDSTIPKVTISYTDKASKSINLYATVNPGNVPSGYKYKWYKDGKAIDGATSLTYKATAAGTYKFEVVTGSGNTASATYVFSPVNVTCPTLVVTDSTGKPIKNNTWINDYVFVQITPSQKTVSYDVYLNDSGYYDSINKNFTYYNTFNSTVKVKLVNGGIRLLKIIIKDKDGNQNICYSKNYYLK